MRQIAIFLQIRDDDLDGASETARQIRDLNERDAIQGKIIQDRLNRIEVAEHEIVATEEVRSQLARIHAQIQELRDPHVRAFALATLAERCQKAHLESSELNARTLCQQAANLASLNSPVAAGGTAIVPSPTRLQTAWVCVCALLGFIIQKLGESALGKTGEALGQLVAGTIKVREAKGKSEPGANDGATTGDRATQASSSHSSAGGASGDAPDLKRGNDVD